MTAAVATVILHLASGATETHALVYPAGDVPPGFACAALDVGTRLVPAMLNIERRDPIVAMTCRE